MAKKKKKGGLPSKYAKMGFKKGWEEYKKVHPTKTKKTKRKTTKRKTAKQKPQKRKTKRKARKTRAKVTRARYGLVAMAEKGARKLRAKASQMASNYKGAKSRMKTNYGALPFGPKTKAAYRRGVDAARYRSPNAKKWERNWKAGVKR